MRDIKNREDIEFLVNQFYEKVRKDDTIGYFFTEVAGLNFDLHLPKMYDFWESILFKKASYKGNPMLPHILLSQKFLANQTHFKQWLRLWEETINQYFKGENATEALQRAQQIAQLIQIKIQ